MALNERLEKKLAKILTKAGLDEEKVNAIVDEVEEALTEEVAPEEGNPEEAPIPPSAEEIVAPDQVEGDPAPEEIPAPQEEETSAPTDGSIESALQELAAQEEAPVPPQPEVPVDPATQEPLIPQVDPNLVQELQTQLGEANKTIEGLVARIDSLEEALKGAGVITSSSALGDEKPRITPNANRENGDEAFDEVLAAINGK